MGTSGTKAANDSTTLARYIALQIPALLAVGGAAGVLWELDYLSTRVAGGLFGVWLIKDIVAYPFVRRAYERRDRTPVEDLIGACGEVREPLSPAGYVWLGRELWRAEVRAGAEHLPAGSTVVVRATRGLTLIVEPLSRRDDTALPR